MAVLALFWLGLVVTGDRQLWRLTQAIGEGAELRHIDTARYGVQHWTTVRDVLAAHLGT